MTTPIARFAAVDRVDVDASLSAVELARGDRYLRLEDRASYRAAHLLVRACAAELLGCAPATLTVAQRCEVCGARDHGRPHLEEHPDVHVSLSHTRGHVAAAAAWTPCGVDVERLRPIAPPPLALSPAESRWLAAQDDPAAFLRLWVRKEALVKAGFARPDRLAEVDALEVVPDADVADWSDDEAVGALVVRPAVATPTRRAARLTHRRRQG